MKLKFRILTFVLCVAMLLGSMSVFSIAAEAEVITPTGVLQYADRDNDWLIWLHNTGTLPSTPGCLYGEGAVPTTLYDADGNVLASSANGNLKGSFLQDGDVWFCPLIHGDYPVANAPAKGYVIEMAAGTYSSSMGDGTAITLERSVVLQFDGSDWQLFKGNVNNPVVIDSLTVLPGASQNDHIYAGIATGTPLTYNGDWLNRFKPTDPFSGLFFTHNGTTTQFYPDGNPNQGLPVENYNEGVPGIIGSIYLNSFGTAVAGDVVTVKGSWHSDFSGEDLTFENAITFTFDGSAWTAESVKPEVQGIEIPYLDTQLVQVNGQHLYTAVPDESIKLTNGADWTNRFLPYSNDAATYYNGVKTALYEQNGIPYQSSAGKLGFWFLMPAAPAAGDKMSVQGTWYSTTFDEYVTFKAPVEFTFDGTTWNRTSDAPEVEITYDHVFSGSFSAPHDGIPTYFHVNGSESLNNVFFDGTWTDRLEPADANSGIFLNGVKEAVTNEGKLLHLSEGASWFVSWNTAAKAGDVITIKGDFVSTKYSTKITIDECKFVYDGTNWSEYAADTTVYNDITIDSVHLFQNSDAWTFNFNITGTWPTTGALDAYADPIVYINDTELGASIVETYKNGEYLLVKLWGPLTNAIAPQKGDVVTVKAGEFKATEYTTVGIKLTEDFVVTYNGSEWVKPGEAEKVYNELTLTGPHPTNVDYFLSEKASDFPTSWDHNYAGLTVLLNGTAVTAYDFKVPGADVYFKMHDVTLKKGDVLVISGQSDCTNNASVPGIKLTAAVTYYWDGSNWVTELETEKVYNELTLGAPHPNDADTFLVEGTTVVPDSWDYNYTGLTVTLNGTAVTNYDFKKPGSVYVKLLNVTLAKGDVLVISGRSDCTSHPEMAGIKLTAAATYYWDGAKWVAELEQPKPDVNYVDLMPEGVDTSTAQVGDNFHIYLTTTVEMPGTSWEIVDGVSISYAQKIDIDGTVYTAIVKKYTDKGMFLEFPASYVKENSVLTLLAGKYASDLGDHGYNLTEDFTINYNGTSWTVPESGIYDNVYFNGANHGWFAEKGWWDIHYNTEADLPGTDWVTAFNNIVVEIDGVVVPATVKKAGKRVLNVFYAGAEPQVGTTVTIKAGKSASSEVGTNGIAIAEDYTMIWDGTKMVRKTIDENVYVEATGKSVYSFGTADNDWRFNLVLDTRWPVSDAFVAMGDLSVYINDVALDGSIVDVYKNGDKLLLCLWGELTNGVAPVAGDKVTIKAGKSVIGDTTYGLNITRDIVMEYDGTKWVMEGYVDNTVYSEVTLKLPILPTGYNASANRWDFYFPVNGTLPGTPDGGEFFDYFYISVLNSKGETLLENYPIRGWNAAHGDGTFFFVVESAILPKDQVDRNSVLTVHAGKTAGSNGVNGIYVTADFTVKYNGLMWVSEDYDKLKPSQTNVELSIDRSSLYGGNKNGIYLLTDDILPVDTSWVTRIAAATYDGISGIYYNDQLIENAYICRFAEGKLYIALVDAGVVAKDKDKVTIKGMFFLNDKAVSYKEYTVYFNGKQWNETYQLPPKESYTKFTAEKVDPVSSYSSKAKQWNTYLRVDAMIPGDIDTMSFSGLKFVTMDGKEVDAYVAHSYQHCLYVAIPDEVLPRNSKNGDYVTLKAGRALANDQVSGIQLLEDIRLYYYMGSLSLLEPTNDTVFEEVTITRLNQTFNYDPNTDEWRFWWQILAPVEGVDTGTPFGGFEMEIDGKTYDDVIVMRDGNYLFVRIPGSVLPGNTRFGTVSVKSGAKGYANSGHNGIVIMNDWEAYIYEGLCSEVEFTETTRFTFDITGVQAATPSATTLNLYLRVNSEVPGTEWYERYSDFVYYYNGKPVKGEVFKSGSSNNKFIHLGVVYKDTGREPVEGDIITIYPNTVGYGGGYEIEVTNEFTLVYKDGLWTPYVETDVEAPALSTDNIWEEFRFDPSYIPVLQENGKVLWSNEDTYHDIISTETHKDYTFEIEVQKVYDDETTPPFYVILRGNQVSEEDALTPFMLYGYVIQFAAAEITDPNDPEKTIWSQYISLWKNGINAALIDQYRINYVHEQTDHPFYKYEETHKYEFSVYNITDTMACITVKVDGRLVLRYYDTASSDPMDPVNNGGTFLVSSSCPGYITGDAVELPEMIVESTECETGDRIRVSATYPFTAEGAVFTVDSADAEIKNGVFIAQKAGTYTISCTYNGKDLGSKTITVKDPPKRQLLDVTQEPEIPWMLIIIAGGAVIIAAAVLVIILALVKRKKKAAAAKAE